MNDLPKPRRRDFLKSAGLLLGASALPHPQRRYHLRRRTHPSEQPAEGGRIWRNVTTEEVSKVAETPREFRGRYKYNLLDENVRRFNAEVPQIWQWDDHEVVNNWSDSKDVSADARYTVKDVPFPRRCSSVLRRRRQQGIVAETGVALRAIRKRGRLHRLAALLIFRTQLR